MWQHVHGAAFNARVMSQQPSQPDDHDAHAHSPQRRAEARESKGPPLAPVPFNLPVTCAILPTPHAIRSRGLSLPGGYWGGGAIHSLPDPFFENGYAMGLGGHRSKESSSYGNGSNDDHSMPDYSYYGSANSSRSTSGVIARPDIHDEHVEHIHEVMGGQRDGSNGTKAPANTRQSSASNTPVLSKPSAASTARSVSHGQPPPRPLPANKDHDLSDKSAESRIHDQLRMHPPTAKEISDQLCTHSSTARENTHPIPRTTPTAIINGKQARGEKGQVLQGAGPVTPCEAEILLPASRATSCGSNSAARREASFSVEYITINSSGSKRRMSGDNLPCPDSPTKRRVVSKGRLVSARCAPLQVAKEDGVVKDTKESPP
ncbi:MAG: hypothetical protein M1824_001515 [Vezdaea acicularis]|nr:MAG: hypothetical protein M1824_001515 [Vezdaea acicularis]